MRPQQQPVIIVANDDAHGRKVFSRSIQSAFPEVKIVQIENIADVYAVIKQCQAVGKRIAALVTDERFEAGRESSWTGYIRASRELTHIRDALDKAYGNDGASTPIIIVSGGEIPAKPAPNSFFLSVGVFDDLEARPPTNPLWRLLNAALGKTVEGYDAIRNTTEESQWER